jgi:hypothetical protein
VFDYAVPRKSTPLPRELIKMKNKLRLLPVLQRKHLTESNPENVQELDTASITSHPKDTPMLE